MANTDTFYTLGIKDQVNKEEINYILEKAPFLAMMPLEETTHGWQDLSEVVLSVDGLTSTDLDAPLQEIGYDSEIQKTMVSSFGAKITVGEDKAEMFGGASEYFAKQMPKNFAKTGMNFDQTLLINSVRQYAIANGNIIKAGGSGSTNYSILGVTWERGEVTGIYNAKAFGKGAMIDVKPINGSDLHDIGGGVLGYGVRMKTNVGIKLLNPHNVGAIVNIDIENAPDSFVPLMLNKLIANINPGATSVLVMHPALIPYIQEMKFGKLTLRNEDYGVDVRIYDWNGVTIMTDGNMPKGNEAKVA